MLAGQCVRKPMVISDVGLDLCDELVFVCGGDRGVASRAVCAYGHVSPSGALRVVLLVATWPKDTGEVQHDHDGQDDANAYRDQDAAPTPRRLGVVAGLCMGLQVRLLR